MRHSPTGSEAKLLSQARRGEEQAFSELVRQNSASVFGISLKILKNREDAEDNLQNVFWKAYQNIGRFHGQARVSTWLYRIAVNEALMKLRRMRSEQVVGYLEAGGIDEGEGGILALEDWRPDPERQCIAADLKDKAFRACDPALANAFVLNKAEGWTNRELAKVFGTSAQTVKSRIFRTRNRLRQQVQELSRQPEVAANA
jgi:RNA polymerase sigma-70 factor (ECF subfamily)